MALWIQRWLLSIEYFLLTPPDKNVGQKCSQPFPLTSWEGREGFTSRYAGEYHQNICVLRWKSLYQQSPENQTLSMCDQNLWNDFPRRLRGSCYLCTNENIPEANRGRCFMILYKWNHPTYFFILNMMMERICIRKFVSPLSFEIKICTSFL